MTSEEISASGSTAASLRSGSIKVAVGLAFFGGATYAFQTVTARAVGSVGYADFAVFWGLVYGVGLGAFLPFEQEVSRRVSEQFARGGSGAAVLRTAYRAAAGVTLVLALAMLVVVPLVSKGTLSHSASLWAASVAAFAGLGLAYVSRGGLSGTRRFSHYSRQLGVEGGVRLAAALVLPLVAVTSPWPYAAVVAIGLFVAVPLTARSTWRQPATGEAPIALSDLGRSLGAVIISSTIAQLLVNFGPVVVRLLSQPSEQALAGRFMAAALVARLPIFLFAAIQAVLIPRLVDAVVRGDHRGFVRSVRAVMVPTVALGLLGMLGCAALGPQILRLVLGPDFALPRLDITLLAASTGLFLVTLVLQPAAISLKRHRQAALTWVAAAVVFGVGCLLPLSPVRTVEIALIVATAAAVGGLSVLVLRGVAAHEAEVARARELPGA